MCLAIPAKVIEIHGETAKVSIGGTTVNIGLQMVDDVRIGDYVLVHTGFALQKISEEEAKETLEIIKEYEQSFDQTDQKE
ncbi:MAG: HypC/HybG/HupF family hydrogenase formation chaperone [Bacteroidales bacterium]|nr:HypC/HybG/HupF family hydrogenase formation chaperone [Bacteroidales bacterium]